MSQGHFSELAQESPLDLHRDFEREPGFVHTYPGIGVPVHTYAQTEEYPEDAYTQRQIVLPRRHGPDVHG